MSKLVWDDTGKKQYESGVSKGVLYKYNATTQKWEGVAWNGLISVTESPDGAEETELWADNIKYGSLRSAEKFGGSIEAYTYPPEFEGCDGTGELVPGVKIGQQKREVFCMSYVTNIANDQNPEAGYKIHLVYNATCTPSEKSYETVNDSPDAITFSWDFDTVPAPVTGHKPTSHITISTLDFPPSGSTPNAKITALENLLYGTENAIAELPMPDDLRTLMAA